MENVTAFKKASNKVAALEPDSVDKLVSTEYELQLLDQEQSNLQLLVDNTFETINQPASAQFPSSQTMPKINVRFDEQTQSQTQESIESEVTKAVQKLNSIQDPGAGLTAAEQVLITEQLTSTVMAPLNMSSVDQVVQSPLKTDEFFTVQVIFQNTRQFDPAKTEEDLERGIVDLCQKCPRGHELKYGEEIKQQLFNGQVRPTSRKMCDVCGQNLWQERTKNWRCDECVVAVDRTFKFFDLCTKCHARQFVRRQLEAKTTKHRYFKPHEITINMQSADMIHQGSNDDQYYSKTQNEGPMDFDRNLAYQEAVDVTDCLWKKDSGTDEASNQVCVTTLREKEMQTANLANSRAIESHDFAYAQEVPNERQAPKLVTNNYILIGAWRCVQNMVQCYRQFRVDSPLYQRFPDYSLNFLHVSQEDEIFFFERTQPAEGEPKTHLTTIDLSRASQAQDTSLVCLEPGLFRLPTVPEKSFELTNHVETLILLHFDRLKHKGQSKSFSLKICQLVQGLLIVPTDQQLTQGQDEGSSQLIKSQKKNLLFCDLQSMKVVNQIFWAQIFVQFETKDDQKFAWVVNERAITKYKWEANPPLNRKLVQKMDRNLVQQEFSFSELDPTSEHDKNSSIEERMFLVLSDKNPQKRSGKVTAILHKDNTRCTIVAESQNWFTFLLKDDKAIQILEHAGCMKDCALVLSKPDSPFICGEMLKERKEHDINSRNVFYAHSEWQFSFYDLNQEVKQAPQQMLSLRTSQSLRKQRSEVLIDHSIAREWIMNLNTDVAMSSDNVYQARMLKLIPLFRGQKNEHDEMDFIVAYQQANPQQTVHIKLRAYKRFRNMKETLKKSEHQLHKPTTLPELDLSVSYPLMMYSGVHPLQNMLYCINFGMNSYQMQLNIYPYRFVKFVRNSLDDIAGHGSKGQSLVYFLAQHKDGNELRLMYYRTYPWFLRDDPEDIPNCELHRIQIVTGQLCIPQSHQARQIKEAILMQNKDVVTGETNMCVIVQFKAKAKQIQCLLFNGQSISLLNNDQSACGRYMQCSPNNTVYFCYYEDTYGFCLGQLSYRSAASVPILTNVYHTRTPIITFQIQHDNYTNLEGEKIGLYILDAAARYRHLESMVLVAGRKNRIQDTQQFKVVETIDLKHHGQRVEELVSLIQNFEFPEVIMSSRAIQTITESTDDNQKQEITSYNLNSGTFFTEEWLGYSEDLELRKKLGLVDTKAKGTKVTALHTEHLPWLAKKLHVVREGSITYVTISRTIDTRRLELFDFKQKREIVNDMKVLDGCIMVETANSDGVYLFDPKSLLLKRKIPCEKALILNLRNNGVQYVSHKYRTSEDLHKYFDDGSSKLVIKDYHLLQKKMDGLIRHIQNLVSVKIKCFVLQKRVTHDHRIKHLIPINISFEDTDSVASLKTQECEPYVKCLSYKRWIQTSSKMCETPPPDGDGMEVVNYFIMGDYLSKLCGSVKNQQQIKYVISQNYIVLGCQRSNLIYFKLSDVESMTELSQSYMEDFIHKKPSIKVSLINLQKLYDSESLDGGIKLRVATGQEIQQVERSKERSDVIQISLKDHLLMWDLEHNEQVMCLSGYSQFSSVETFVQSGMQLYLTPKARSNNNNNSKSQFIRISKNSDSTLACLPKAKGINDYATVFKLFTVLDMRELMMIQTKIRNSELIYQIDKNSVLANFYGFTLFQVFCGHEQAIFKIILQQIQDAQLERYTDERGIEYDHIYIRQLYQVLTLPYDSQILQRTGQKSLLYHFMQKTCEKRITNEILLRVDKTAPQHIQLAQKLMTHRILQTKIEMLKSNQKLDITKNIVQSCFQYRSPDGLIDVNSGMLEMLVELLLLSQESSLSDVISGFDDFKKLFKIQSATIDTFLQQQFIQTEMTKNITVLSWQKGVQLQTFGANTSQYSSDTISQEIIRVKGKYSDSKSLPRWLNKILLKLYLKNQAPETLMPVQVRILEIEWLKKDLRFFYKFLAGHQDVNIFSNELIRVLLKEQNYSTEIFVKMFIPHCLYFIVTLWYFTYVLTEAPANQGFFYGTDYQVACRVLILVLTILLLGVELSQLIFLKMTYIYDRWNLLYVFSFLLNISLVANHSSDYFQSDPYNSTMVGAVAVLLVWVMIFYWCRLSENFAFYVLMMTESFYDIRFFLLLFFLVSLTFGNAMLILDLKLKNMAVEAGEEYNPLMEAYMDLDLLDAFLNQYMLGLGEFNYGDFEGSKLTKMAWLFFFCATIITNIAFLNVLIAIVSDTYSRITEAKDRYALMQRTKIYADFIYTVRLSKRLTTFKYLYVVTPCEDSLDQNDQDWTGSINTLKRLVSKEARTSRQEAQQEMKSVRQNVSALAQQVDKLQSTQEKMNDTIQQVLQKLGAAEDKH